jgi:zinc D-Ala-D-Ala carboxypeptidase
MIQDVQLSPHFWLSEFLRSETASRAGLRNEPDFLQLAQLRRLAHQAEDVRTALRDAPVLISSGLRTLIVNGLVCGVITVRNLEHLDSRPDLLTRLRDHPSAHKAGRAFDFTAPAFGSPRDIVARLRDTSLPFDQVICEGTWVHYGIAPEHQPPRRQVLTAVFQRGSATRYVPFH